MLLNVLPEIENHPPSYSNWLDLHLNFSKPFYEIIICGADALKQSKELNSYYIPNKLLVGTSKESDLPLFAKRFVKDKTLFYVCEKGRCGLPTDDLKSTLKSIKK